MVAGAIKLDPTQADKWWKTRIDKEQAFYEGKKVDNVDKARVSTISLNPLGTLTVLDVQKNDAQHQGISIMRSPRSAASEPLFQRGSPRGSPRAPESYVGSMVGSGAGRPRGEGSQVSSFVYPRTPNFSQAGSGEDNVEIMDRLSKLEKDLTDERLKRQAAQDEMKELLSRTGSRASTPAARAPVHRSPAQR